MTLPFFNELNIQSLNNNYQANSQIDGQEVQLDLNFENNSIQESKLSQMKIILEDLKLHVDEVKLHFQNEHKNGETVKEYLTYHMEELDSEEIHQLIKNTKRGLSKEEKLLSVLKLIRIGFYPDNDNEYAVYDFATDEELSQYLLVAKTNKQGELIQIVMES